MFDKIVDLWYNMTHKSRKEGEIMYNEYDEKEKKDFSLLKNFLMRLILIVIFVLLLIWLVPWPDMSGLAPLQEQIFNNNINTMKEAAIGYYTTERLPQNVGDKKTLTLQEMLDLHLLTPFVDKNGNTCSLTESYVTIEKVDEEEYNYLMKVNLKCSDKEDYIYVYLGCYSYCEGYICEKKEEDEIKDPSPTPTNKPRPTTTPTPTSNPTDSPKPTDSPDPTPTDSPDPTTSPTPTDSPDPTTSPTPTDSPDPTTSPTPTTTPDPDDKYEYEYKKTTEAEYSAWSSWKVWTYNDNDNVNWTNTDTYQIQDLGAQKVQIGTRVNTGVVTRQELTKVGTESYKVCTGYSYTADKTTLYEIVSDWAYTNDYYRGYNPPADTMTTRWVLQDWKVNECVGTCTNHVYLVYRKQTRQVKQTTEATNISATCTGIETRSVDIYITTIKSQTLKTEIPLYGYKKFYRDRTRKLISAGSTKYTWSDSPNDANLISQGWKPTGEKRKK